jgi:predicted MFS family arabinose efflux permease
MTGGLLLLFAFATGQAVASNYYAQPLLATIREQFHLSTGLAGLVVTVSQVGYALGLIFFLPLGDLLERRRLITTMAAVNALGLAAAALAPSVWLFLAAVAVVGVSSTMAQILVPFAAGLAAEGERGRVVGTVMSGLLLGILLGRTVAGLVAQVAGWRSVYWLAAAAMIVMTLILRRELPTWRERSSLSYPRLLASVLSLAREEPVLRHRAVFGLLSFASFTILWTVLAFLLAGPAYGYGEGVIGLFGLAGAAGAATAMITGRFTDRGWANGLTILAALLMAAAYALLWLGATGLVLLLLGIVVLDVGCQAMQITNQSEIYRLRPEARSRINAFYMTCCFVGAAGGSAASAFTFARFGWAGSCVLGAGIGLVALAYWAVMPKTHRRAGTGSASPAPF